LIAYFHFIIVESVFLFTQLMLLHTDAPKREKTRCDLSLRFYIMMTVKCLICISKNRAPNDIFLKRGGVF